MDLLDIPSLLGDTLGVSDELAGLIISVAIIISVALILAVLKFNLLGTVSALLCVMVLLVAMTWLPYWVLLFVCLLIAAMFGKSISDWFAGTGSPKR